MAAATRPAADAAAAPPAVAAAAAAFASCCCCCCCCCCSPKQQQQRMHARTLRRFNSLTVSSIEDIFAAFFRSVCLLLGCPPRQQHQQHQQQQQQQQQQKQQQQQQQQGCRFLTTQNLGIWVHEYSVRTPRPPPAAAAAAAAAVAACGAGPASASASPAAPALGLEHVASLVAPSPPLERHTNACSSEALRGPPFSLKGALPLRGLLSNKTRRPPQQFPPPQRGAPFPPFSKAKAALARGFAHHTPKGGPPPPLPDALPLDFPQPLPLKAWAFPLFNASVIPWQQQWEQQHREHGLHAGRLPAHPLLQLLLLLGVAAALAYLLAAAAAQLAGPISLGVASGNTGKSRERRSRTHLRRIAFNSTPSYACNLHLSFSPLKKKKKGPPPGAPFLPLTAAAKLLYTSGGSACLKRERTGRSRGRGSSSRSKDVGGVSMG
ncbi:hypothetical protein Emag_007394 [Eimeria magna]